MSHFLTYVIVQVSKLNIQPLDKEESARIKKARKDLEKKIKAGLASGKMKISEAAHARETIEETIADLPRFGAIRNEVDRLLAPYDENEQVDPYERTCYCVGTKANEDARKSADALHGTVDSLRKSFHARDDVKALQLKARTLFYLDENGKRFEPTKEQIKEGEAAEKKIEKLWREYAQPWQDARDKAFDEHPLKEAADAQCETCKGTGKEVTRYNPKAKWDWWRIGGRYDGVITQTEVKTDDGFNFGSQHESPELNTLSGSQLPSDDAMADIIPFAIVTPDGVWHQRGEMGWWAIVSDEKEDWNEQAVALLAKYRSDDYLIVACDLHI